MNYLGLDVGQKRIGLSIGSKIAEEYSTLEIKWPAKSFLDESIGTFQASAKILQIIHSEEIEKIIVGIPYNSNGSQSFMAEKIFKFINYLKNHVLIPIDTTNEILTSFAAEELLKEEGLTFPQIKRRVDQVSAKIILQQYIENQD